MIVFRSIALIIGLIVLATPLVVCVCYAAYSKVGVESLRRMRWVRYRQLAPSFIPLSIAIWWALWTYGSGDKLLGDYSFIFVLLPLVSVTALLLLSAIWSRTFLETKWKFSDVVRMTFWRAVERPIPLLLVSASFDALVAGRWLGILGLVIAAVCGLVGGIQTRIAEGLKLRRVRSGETYKRAALLARRCGIKLEHIFIVPSGPGRLTNAYGGGGFIAVTDNFGEYLNQAELDATIGHEFGHVKHGHGRKQRKAVVAAYVVASGISFWPARELPILRPALDLVIVLAPILFLNYLARRFEFEADRHGLAVTGSVETSVRALALMYREAGGLADCNSLLELFMTHPNLTCRAESLADAGHVSRDVAYQILAATGFRAPDAMPKSVGTTAAVQ
jgi:Zn-dependent protease with chaperone function